MIDILICNVKDCAVYDIDMPCNCSNWEDGEYPNICYRYWKNIATLEKQRREAAEILGKKCGKCAFKKEEPSCGQCPELVEWLILKKEE